MPEKISSEELIAEAKEFFEYYKHEIGKSSREGKNSVSVLFNDIAAFSHELSESLLQHPEEVLQLLELALDETGLVKNARLRLVNLPLSQKLKIGDIRAKDLSHLITIEGIIRQASEVRPKVIDAKFECPSCGTIISILQTESHFTEPKRCSCGRKANFKLISKNMVDAQRLVVEESPESLSGGEQPRHIAVFLKEDLVEPQMEKRTTPGTKVNIIGILKEVPVPLRTGAISTKFDLSIEANNIIPLQETFEELEITDEDEREIRELATSSDLYERLRDSIAPSVFGYKELKESLALQLFGGVRKEKSDRTFSRGDMHILLVGDPGVAKSVILKFVSAIAPRGRYISGRQATGAGMTATVIKDEFLRGWSLEAGTMVLAHKGIACIDEIEDMDPKDRSAMHEALEQQTVTISKANVQATLRSETSVLAAANPKLGRFDLTSPIAPQINLDVPLLSRFDLIFVMQDLPDRGKDEAIATHVLSEHKKDKQKKVIEPELLRKYIAYSKQKIIPELTDKAAEEIKSFYVDLRNIPVAGEDIYKKPMPITARQLEALVRLSEAHAKARLSNKVTREDAKRAIELLKHCLMKVGYDYETKQFDIDRIATGIGSSERGKLILVRDAIRKIESRSGKLISEEDIFLELGDKIDRESIEDALEKLTRTGDIFKPKKGYVQVV